MVKYKPLQEAFTKKGWSYKLLKREKNIAIYEVSKGNFINYEVIIIKTHDGFLYPNGIYNEPAEMYPNSNSWGINGFSYRELTKAEQKYKTLLKT